MITEEELSEYIKRTIYANNTHPKEFGGEEFYDGANTALKELADVFIEDDELLKAVDHAYKDS